MDKKTEKIVIKIGTSSLTYKTGMLNLRKIEHLCRVIADLENSGKKLVIVSSGAVSAGWNKMGLLKRPDNMVDKQAAAAVGQCELMNIYNENMLKYGHTVAQILFTREAFEDPTRRQNAENTIRVLLEHGCIPIVNENDSVSCTEMLKIGDNDRLSAYVACVTDADLLINLSDVDGLYDSDPHKNPNAHHVGEVHDVDAYFAAAEGSGTDRGTGGMHTKLVAAKIANDAGIPMIIASGDDPEILYEIFDGKQVGTLFTKEKK